MAEIITVSVLNRYVKTLLDANEVLFDLALKGEISNFVRNARSGHLYFSLRDEQCSVKAVMFRSDAQRVSFQLKDGMKVIVRCRVTLYERDGAFQVYVNDVFPDGLGSAQLAFEQLKARLDAEGLFDPAHKKQIPSCPSCIGIVTSKTGAALQDIVNVISRRWPCVKLVLSPVNVQGFEAAEEIIRAIRSLDLQKRIDLIIVARGGGSREDLWVFNSEQIARAAYACRTPLISAIGHEIDFTILDFVADLRAPTPSAAAELAVPDQVHLKKHFCILAQNIHNSMQKRMELCYNKLDVHRVTLNMEHPSHNILKKRGFLEKKSAEIKAAMQKRYRLDVLQLQHIAALTNSLSPYRVLARGYTMLTLLDGTVCTVSQLVPGEQICLKDTTHKAICTVTTVEAEDEST